MKPKSSWAREAAKKIITDAKKQDELYFKHAHFKPLRERIEAALIDAQKREREEIVQIVIQESNSPKGDFKSIVKAIREREGE